MSEWINVKDRLPNAGIFVLVHYPPIMDGISIGINIYSRYGWELTQTEAFVQGITHWMQLPEPPKD